MGVDREIEWRVHQVNLTTARNLSPLFDEAIRKERPVVITRGSRECGVLIVRDQLLRLLQPYAFHVDVIPEETGGFTLWVRELNLGEHGSTLLEARDQLLDGVRSYVRYYLDNWDFFRHLPDKAAQEPYVHRLSLARDDVELVEMLFGTGEESRPNTDGSMTAIAG